MSNLFVLDAIKKRDDNNLIDLTLFSEVTRINNKCDNFNKNEWDNESRYEKSVESRSRKNLTKTFSTECNGNRVRDSVLEAFDPLLESESEIKITKVEVQSGNNIKILY